MAADRTSVSSHLSRFFIPRPRPALLVKLFFCTLILFALLRTWGFNGQQRTNASPQTHFLDSIKKRVFSARIETKDIVSSSTDDKNTKCDMCDEPFAMQPGFVDHSGKNFTNDTIPVFREFAHFQPWPEMTQQYSLPGQIPSVVHYLWCGKKYFEFRHYLGVLSLVRQFQPVKIIFHYHSLPELDYLLYNTWFVELKQSLPGLVLKPIPASQDSPCVTGQFLPHAFPLLQQHGGIYVTSNVIVTHVPRDLQRQTWWAALAGHPTALDARYGIVIAPQGFVNKTLQEFARLATPGSGSAVCVPTDSYEHFRTSPSSGEDSIQCVYLSDAERIYPKTIMHANTSFGEVGRWLYYGKRTPMRPKTVPNSIPRISHMIWISSDNSSKTYTLQFDQYLSILSALHVGGFERVYLHGNVGFRGEWWERLKSENVTFVYIEDPERIFQQGVLKPETKSNILRNSILYKYGGAYHDFDAVWTQRVPDWLLAYPAVGGPDWVIYGEWPDTLNNGILMAKPQAPWVRFLQAYYRYYTEGKHWTRTLYGAIMTTYRTYERHPDELLLYDRLQVMCHHFLCHPAFENGFRREMGDRRKTLNFDWLKDTLVVHVTQPAAPSFASPTALKNGQDMEAKIGRYILQKSGREDILR